MASLTHRAAAALVAAAGLVGATAATPGTAFAVGSVSPTITQEFDGVGTSVGTAYNIALGQAVSAGFTAGQCSEHVIRLGAGFWEVDLTCTK